MTLIVLLLLAWGTALFGLSWVTGQTAGVAFICLGCLFAISARILQAGAPQNELRRWLKPQIDAQLLGKEKSADDHEAV